MATRDAGDVVVDTNVLVIANARVSTASPECGDACVAFLEATIADGRVVVDTFGEVITEYQTYCRFQGAPGVGDLFFRWLHDNEFNGETCERVELTRHPNRGFEEFPSDPGLVGFDASDRKFVALAVALTPHREIVVAADRGWRRFKTALTANSVEIRFLCPQDLPPASGA
jgi:hypothetical protein